MNSSFEYYKVFYYVARYLNISKAASVLSTSQPNVTRTIKKLENELGCELFIRKRSGVALTGNGERLYRHVKEALRQIETAEARIAEDLFAGKKSVSIGFSIAIPNNVIEMCIIPAIGLFHNDYPDIHLVTVNKPTPELISDVRKGVLDLAIISTSDYQSIGEPEGRVILEFHDTIIAGRKLADEFKGEISMEEILKYPIIGFPENTETFSLYDHENAERGLEYHVDIEVTNYSHALSFVKNNLGLGCIPEYLALSAIGKGWVTEVVPAERLPIRRVSVLRNESEKDAAAAILEDYILKLPTPTVGLVP